MSEAPERIWAEAEFYDDNGRAVSGYWVGDDNMASTEYVRADFHATAIREAVEAERQKWIKRTEVDPYSDEWAAICDKGYADHHKQMRGARGQTVTPMDNPEYWICRAFAAAIRTPDTEQEGQG